jgi:hypothetical protein
MVHAGIRGDLTKSDELHGDLRAEFVLTLVQSMMAT